MHARTKTSLALGALALGVGYSVYKRRENPAWTPWSALLSSTRDKVLALEKVKVTSVPTPHETAALDPGMSTDQVKQVNHSLSSETDMHKLANHAVALSALGHDNSAAAVAAKTVAIGEAKATGAKDADVHVKQVEAAAVPISPAAVATGFWGGHGGFGGHGYGGHGWSHPWGWDRWRQPPVVEEIIDPATGLPVVTGIDPRFGRRGLEQHHRAEHRGFGRDPRFPHDRFGGRFTERGFGEERGWDRGRRRHHEPWVPPAQEAIPEEQFAAPGGGGDDPWHRRWLEEHQALLALQQQQQVATPAVADPATDADDAATTTGWWGWGDRQ